MYEGLEQEEKVVFSPCCPGALGVEGLEQEESPMYEGLEQAVSCLRSRSVPQPLCFVAKQSTMNEF
jgi:hypothetical protein